MVLTNKGDLFDYQEYCAFVKSGGYNNIPVSSNFHSTETEEDFEKNKPNSVANKIIKEKE